MITPKFTRRVVCSLLAGTAVLAHAQSTTFPNRPITVVVQSAPGGLLDAVARALGPKMAKTLGQEIVVDNKAGAGGIIAAAAVAKAAPDGHTLFLTDQGPSAINPVLYKKLPYDPVKDFEPVASVAIAPLFLVANASAPFNDLKGLIAYSKSHPKAISYGSTGVGSLHHLSMESLRKEFGIEWVHVPYRSTAQSVPAVVAGEVQLLFSALPAATAFLQNGRIKLLGVNSPARSPKAPDVPAIGEALQIKDYAFASEMGILAPAGTPAAAIAKLNEAVRVALQDKEVLERFGPLGIEARPSTAAEYGQMLQRQLVRFDAAVRSAGLAGSQ
jgi:tripartite-type tricarboxylate transporter receptor subunit TctC